MYRFHIRIHSFQDVQEFANLAAAQNFPVVAGNENYHVNAASLMGVFTLDCSNPIPVMVECSEEEFHRFLQAADRFLGK